MSRFTRVKMRKKRKEEAMQQMIDEEYASQNSTEHKEVDE
jgi:hypothetical protein